MTTQRDAAILLSNMTWSEIQQAQSNGFTRAIFACGATEQHGRHLPLAVDALVGEALSSRVAHKLGRTLVGPVVPIGCSDHHMEFAGTLSLREETFKAVVTDYCRSLIHHGFTEILVLPSHGGNFRPVDEIVSTLRAEHPDVTLIAYGDLLDFVGSWREIISAAGGLSSHVGGHADIAESSMLLALRPDLVRAELVEPGFLGDLEEALPIIWKDGFAALTENGVLGDPTGLSAELGHQLLDGVSTAIATYFDNALSAEQSS